MAGETYVATVHVHSDANKKRMYLHQVDLRENVRAAASRTGANAAEAGAPTGAAVGRKNTILRDIYAVNEADVSKIVDENGKPRM